MVDVKKYFTQYCKDYNLHILFSVDMPDGYKTAYGTFDITKKTLFYNENMLADKPEYMQLFFLFHELRHTLQYCQPELFDEMIHRSLPYVIMYNGVCYLKQGDIWKECILEGTEEFFTNAYLGHPCEVDANLYAYEAVKNICGESKELDSLFQSFLPEKTLSDEQYLELYDTIDRAVLKNQDK